MKRITMLAVLALVASAAAATDGTYRQGNTKTGAGVRMTVANGTFAIKIVRLRETCKYGEKVIHDFFTFKSGSRAHITGPISDTGAFSGKYAASAGQVKVSGTISDTTATIKAVESGPYNFASTTHPNSCKGSRTFTATLAGG